MKKLCAGLLLIVLLMPTLSLRDDVVKLGTLLLKLNLHRDSWKTSDNGAKDHDRYRLDLPDYLEHLKLTPVTALHFDTSSSAVQSISPRISAQDSTAIRTGRAPPLA
jgi:hypothetical protein